MLEQRLLVRGEQAELALRLDQQLGRDQVAGLEAEQVRLVGVERGAEPAQEPAARDRPVARPEACRGARRQPDLRIDLLGPESERVQATLDRRWCINRLSH